MVKRKTQPKTKNKAGYAARTAEPVHDSTSDSTSASSEKENSQSDGEQERQPIRPAQKQPQMAAARHNPATTRDKVQKTIVKPDVRKKGSALKVLKDIRLLQKTTNLLIPRAPFLRLIKYLIQERSYTGMRVTESAVEALREASESFLTSMFEDSYMLALHAKRVTLFPRDINLLLHLRRDPACS